LLPIAVNKTVGQEVAEQQAKDLAEEEAKWGALIRKLNLKVE